MKRFTKKIPIKIFTLLSSVLFLSAIFFNTKTGQADPSTACNPLRSNEVVSSNTVSDSCIEAVIAAGAITIEYKPGSFSFPRKFTTTYAQPSFSNDDALTRGTVDVTTGPEDILTVKDLRNSGGFAVNITADAVSSEGANIPLRNLYVVTTYPDSNDFDTLDSALRGTQTAGVEYAAGAVGTENLSAPAFTTGSLNTASTYTTDGASFDANNDLTPDTITLMSTGTAHLLRASQALSFYLNIPANPTAGTYNIALTLDLVT